MNHDFFVSVHGERAAIFVETLGSADHVPVRSPIPELAMLPGFAEPQRIFHLALDQITTEQRERVVAYIARRFGIPPEEVARDLDVVGVPILDRDCSVIVHNPQRWLT